MMVVPIRSGAVASMSSSVVGLAAGSTSGSGFSQLVAGSPPATNGMGQYNASIAEMAAQNLRLLEHARASGMGVGQYNAAVAELAARNQRPLAGAGTEAAGQYSASLAEMSAQMRQMLEVQIAVQKESLLFSAISNVLKTKHDTLKTIVGNIR